MAKHRVAPSGPSRPSPRQARAPAIDPSAARLAWEFLRRNDRYRADYERVGSGAIEDLPAHWGLCEATDPDASDIDAVAIWRAPVRSRRRAEGSWAGSPPASARCSRRACPDTPPGCRTGA
ncbi:transcriptional regulator domain-containing protein [Caulobacter sp. UNC358MFTsu5.1]|uniref:transcriptional regulator domain-containing protein n=1 Tax=Caulobacter sp. UNC358MFTsu5.1 TaxID=1449049 RepID=UPI00350F9D57